MNACPRAYIITTVYWNISIRLLYDLANYAEIYDWWYRFLPCIDIKLCLYKLAFRFRQSHEIIEWPEYVGAIVIVTRESPLHNSVMRYRSSLLRNTDVSVLPFGGLLRLSPLWYHSCLKSTKSNRIRLLISLQLWRLITDPIFGSSMWAPVLRMTLLRVRQVVNSSVIIAVGIMRYDHIQRKYEENARWKLILRVLKSN